MMRAVRHQRVGGDGGGVEGLDWSRGRAVGVIGVDGGEHGLECRNGRGAVDLNGAVDDCEDAADGW